MFITGVLSRGFVKRSEDSVSAPSSYLPSADDYEDDSLPGYSSDDLPGYSGDDLPGYSGDDLPGYSGSGDAESDDDIELTEASGRETTTEAVETTTLGEEDLIRYNAGLDDLPGSGDGEEALSDYSPSEESTTPAPESETDSGDTTPGPEEKAEAAVSPAASFLSYSALSPAVSLCPGGSVEVCVTACPGSSGRVYGACVQGCADRCGGELP